MKYKYVGPEILTRGEYGERVERVHRGNFSRDGRDGFTPSGEGDSLAVWDTACGWIFWGLFDPDDQEIEECKKSEGRDA